jgi:subtilisin family serine protease
LGRHGGTQQEAEEMVMRPRRTALDGSLGFQARVATRPEIAGDLAADFARASLSVAPTERATVDGRATVKLLVEPGAADAARTWAHDHGGEVVERADTSVAGGAPTVVLATVPVSALSTVDDHSWMRRVEAPRLLLPRLDEARGPATGVDEAIGQHGLTGAGVVLAVVDTGVDWRHPDFRNADGTTRFERFVHAHAVDGGDESRFDVFDAKALDAALDGEDGVPDGDPHGHGTHCASIAAGNGRGSGGQFRGVATGATVMAVRSEPLLDTHSIEGIRQAFELAGDRPAVVSMSLGGHLGPHDGTTALENEIARMTGPGRIVVVAAGNEGSDQIHAEAQLVEGEDLVIPIRVGDEDLQFVDVWIPRGDEVDIWVQTPDGGRHEPDGTVQQTVFGAFRADFVEDQINGDQNLTLLIGGGRLNHRWGIRVRPTTVLHGAVHAWAGTVNPSTSAFLFPEATSPGYSVGMPGTEERAIVVASAVSRNRAPTVDGELVTEDLTVGGLSPFSSHGPTRIGIHKPDVAAPGQYVTAALSAGSEMATAARYRPRHSPTSGYITIQGTSMATPFVAGVVALLLEREPTLTPEDVQQRLRVTSRRDRQTGPVWNPAFGWGKLDARALLDYQAATMP